MSGEPVLYLWRAMGAVIVHHQMQRHFAGELTIDTAEEAQKLLVTVTLIAIADDFAGEYIERRKQSRRAVSFVVVSHGATAPFLQRQSRLGTLQGLNLALLVHAKHNCLVGRIQIKADHVSEFLEEFRIA